MSSYDDVYYAVLSCEEIYYDWTEVTQGIDGSYRIFKSIVNIYETLHQVDLACRHREIAYTVRNKIINMSDLGHKDLSIRRLIEMFFLFWYGIWWT